MPLRFDFTLRLSFFSHSPLLFLFRFQEWDPDSGDVLLQAFRTIDAENTGFISSELMEELLTTRGTPFRPKELEDFLKVAKDPETGNIFYEDYVALLMKNQGIGV